MRRPLLAVFLMLILGACSSAGQVSSQSTSPTQSSIPSVLASQTSAASVDATPFVVGWASTPDEKNIPFLMAIDAMKEKGYNISGQQVSSDDILFQGLASNTIHVGFGGQSQTANAAAAGVPIKIVEARSSTDAVYVAAAAFKDCASLDGKPVGIYSPKAILTLFMQLYFDEHCPKIKYTPVTIADSVLRAQAMERGQIVATVLGLADALSLDARNPGKFFTESFGSSLPGVGDAYLVATDTTIRDHPSIVQAWATANLKAIRELYQADDKTLEAIEKKYLPDAKDASILKDFVENKLWYANGGLDGDGLARSLQLFHLPGKAEDLVDATFVDHAISEIGKSDATR